MSFIVVLSYRNVFYCTALCMSIICVLIWFSIDVTVSVVHTMFKLVRFGDFEKSESCFKTGIVIKMGSIFSRVTFRVLKVQYFANNFADGQTNKHIKVGGLLFVVVIGTIFGKLKCTKTSASFPPAYMCACSL